MSKKLLKNLMLVVVMAILCFAVAVTGNALESTGQCGDNAYWTFDESTGELTISGEGPMWDYNYNIDSLFKSNVDIKNVTIEYGINSIGNYSFYECENLCSVNISESVVIIGSNAFAGCTNIKSLKIPGSVTRIESHAFSSCDNLITVDIENGIKEIGYGSFSGCSSLNEIKLPNSVIDIGEYAFCRCESLENVVLPENLTMIGAYTFAGCEEITDITIPENVYYIGSNAFGGTGISSINIPDSVTSINSFAFSNCNNLSEIKISNNVVEIGDNVFYKTAYYNNEYNWDNDVLYIDNYLIEAKDSLSGDYKIKNNTKVIADEAFYYCANLEKITLPDSIVYIGSFAFYNCSGLSSIDLNNGLKSIGFECFYGCTRLTNVSLPDSIEYIGLRAFENSGCFNSGWENGVLYLGNHLIDSEDTLSGELKIKEGTKSIASYALSGTKIESVVLPDGLLTIGSAAFQGCENLTDIYIPASVKTIYDDSFHCCYKLENINVAKDNDYYSSQKGVLFNKDKTKLITYPVGKTDTAYQIPNGTIELGYYAFENGSNIKSLGIPSSIRNLWYYWKTHCLNLTDIKFSGSQLEWFVCCPDRDTFIRVGIIVHYNSHIHNYSENYNPPTCTENGSSVYICTDCKYSETETIYATGHKDTDGDHKCDYGCGYEFDNSTPEEPLIPDNLEEPDDEKNFFEKIIDFFNKIIDWFKNLFR